MAHLLHATPPVIRAMSYREFRAGLDWVDNYYSARGEG
jgi:hypothetical protein